MWLNHLPAIKYSQRYNLCKFIEFVGILYWLKKKKSNVSIHVLKWCRMRALFFAFLCVWNLELGAWACVTDIQMSEYVLFFLRLKYGRRKNERKAATKDLNKMNGNKQKCGVKRVDNKLTFYQSLIKIHEMDSSIGRNDFNYIEMVWLISSN